MGSLKPKIAIVQTYPVPLEAERNFKTCIAHIRTAASHGADLAILPEYHLSGWEPSKPAFIDICKQWEKYLNGYCALAKELGICIVPGTLVEYHEISSEDVKQGKMGDTDIEEGKLWNTAYFISPTGTILGKYIKKNLWHNERGHLSSSNEAPHEVFETPLGLVGMLICWDLAFPEAFRELIAGGAKLILIPSFWLHVDNGHNPMAEGLFIDSTLTARCFENTCGIVYCNAGGPEAEDYAGLSQIVMPFVGPVARFAGPEEGVKVAEIDMSFLEEAEECYKVREDMGREDWYYDYRHTRMQSGKKT